MKKISEDRIKQIIKESIDDVIEFGDSKPTRNFVGGNVSNFTPYSKEEREQNFKGLGRMGNPSYEAFKAWREEGLKRGIPSIELSWEKYKNQK